MDLNAATDRLFQLPLDAFVSERNALSKALRADERREEADRVKSLTKPPVTAWVVNQLYWTRRDRFDALMAAGDAVRQAQLALLSGRGRDALDPAMVEQRARVTELMDTATGLLESAGHGTSTAALRRVQITLEALSAYAEVLEAKPGRVTADLDPPGFEALLAMAASTPLRPTPQPEPEPEPEPPLDFARKKAERALADAEAALDAATAEAEQANQALRVASERAASLGSAADDLARRAQVARDAAEAAATDTVAAMTRAQTAGAALTSAEAAVQSARADLGAL